MVGIDIVALGTGEGKVIASYRYRDGVLTAAGGFDSILDNLAKGLPAEDSTLTVPADGEKFIEAVKRRYGAAAYMSVRVIE